MRLPNLRLLILVSLAVFLNFAGAEEEKTSHVEHVKSENVPYVSPSPSGRVFFAEHFDNLEDFDARWIKSQAKKDGVDENVAKYDGKWAVESALKDGLAGDLGLALKSKAKHAAISAFLDRPFHFSDKPLIVQYDVAFQEGQDCGGAYIKLLTHDSTSRLSQFTDKTPYTIMFGPDKCGNDHKLHFIFRHKNPKNGTFSEKHAKKPDGKLDDYFKDRKPHLYTLVVSPDNTYEVSVDYKVVNRGTLLDDFSPPVNPPTEIDDPEDRKPEDWDEREKIPDPDARKPEDWDEDEPQKIPDPDAQKPAGWLDDEPEMIPDPTAEKPEDWDEDMDGTWEAPLINNPACESAPGCGTWNPPLIENPKFKGKWRPPMIDNPNYRGRWHPRRIPNPDFFEDRNPFKMAPIGAVGLELWSMSDNILFDNIIITDDKSVADAWAAETFDLKRTVADADLLSSGLGRVKFPSHWVQRWRRWANSSTWVWPVYGLVSFLPAVCFLVYLCVWARRDPNKDSVVDRLLKYTNKNPWLWAVYVVVIALPVVLLVSYVCGSQEKKKLKDDAVTEDDKEPLIEEEEEVAEELEEDKPEDEPEVDDKPEEEQQEVIEETPVQEKQSPRRRRTRKE